MTPFQTFYLILSLAVFAVAWLRGGHTERAAVVMILANYLAAYALQTVYVGELRIGEAAADLALLVGIGSLALRRDRWWTLAATALLILTMAAHAAMVFAPELGSRADVAARWGLGVLLILALLAGVVERWLAGEAAVSPGKPWRIPRGLP